MLALAVIFALPAGGETLDSGRQVITPQDANGDGINDSRIVVTDYEYGDVEFRKTDRNANSSFRIRTDTETWTHTIDVVNLRQVKLPGTPDDDYLGNMTADEFFDGMVEYGSVTFILRGSGSIEWTFADLPDNIMTVEIDEEEGEEGVDYEIEGNNLTLSLTMSEHNVTAYFGEAAVLGVAGLEVCIAVGLALFLVGLAFVYYKRESLRRQIKF